MPFLSIIIPVYNVEKYLRECLDSIVNQTFEDFECILVDDGSTDGSGLICDEYVKFDARFHVIHKENEGLVRTRKIGALKAIGRYIGFVDSDDVVHPKMYEDMCQKAKNLSDPIVVCGIVAFEKQIPDDVNNNLTLVGDFSGVQKDEVTSTMLYDGQFFSFGIAPSIVNKIFPRDLFLKHELELDDRIQLGEDAAVTYFCLNEALSVSILDKAYYYYRMNPQSMTHEFDNKKYIKTVIVLDYMLKKIIKIEAKELLKQFQFYAIWMLTNIVYDNIRLSRYDEIKKQYLLQYREMSTSITGMLLEHKYEELNIPNNIKSYMAFMYVPSKFNYIMANIHRLINGVVRRMRK